MMDFAVLIGFTEAMMFSVDNTVLLIIDVQDKLTRVIAQKE